MFTISMNSYHNKNNFANTKSIFFNKISNKGKIL